MEIGSKSVRYICVRNSCVTFLHCVCHAHGFYSLSTPLPPQRIVRKRVFSDQNEAKRTNWQTGGKEQDTIRKSMPQLATCVVLNVGYVENTEPLNILWISSVKLCDVSWFRTTTSVVRRFVIGSPIMCRGEFLLTKRHGFEINTNGCVQKYS